jgi:hypothetical protein
VPAIANEAADAATATTIDEPPSTAATTPASVDDQAPSLTDSTATAKPSPTQAEQRKPPGLAAAPTVRVKAPVAPRATHPYGDIDVPATPPLHPPSRCNPPYDIDASGKKIWHRECF